MDYVLVAAGLVMLVFGAEGLVRGGATLAKRLGISPLIIGVTIIAYGTSAPELVVSVQAALDGSPGIAIGNVVGSNIANIMLILGTTAVIAPIAVSPQAISRDGAFALLATVIFIAIALTSDLIQLWHGLAMLALLAGITVFTVIHEGQAAAANRAEAATEAVHDDPIWLNAAMILGGLGLLILGGQWLVDGAVAIARAYDVSEAVIGLTLVAIGTSLPELATSVVAAIRRHGDIALGNVIGSNIYNIIAILGIASVITPIPIPRQIVNFDMWLMLGVSLLLLPPMFMGNKIGRGYGAMFLIGYIAYLWFLYQGNNAAA